MNARVLESARRDLRLHKMARVSRPVDVTDTEKFPNIEASREWLARLTPERIAELQKEWMA